MTALSIRSITPLSHDVFQYRLDKPDGFSFEPGQATDVAIDKDGWRDKKRPFTFTSLPDDDHLEFTIKSYPDHDGVTEKLSQLLVGDALIIGEPWGAIRYKGPGVFIAGGAGLTPFLSIFRALEADGDNRDVNTLIFANKREIDIFAQTDLAKLIRLKVTHVLSQENKAPYEHGRVDEAFLADRIEDFGQQFYVCGPPQMVEDVSRALRNLGADADGVTFEE